MTRKLVFTFTGFSRILVIIILLVLLNAGRVINTLSALPEYSTDSRLQEQQVQQTLINLNNHSDIVNKTKNKTYGTANNLNQDATETFNTPLKDEMTSTITTAMESRPLAILHIGPHKTGSTTIQAFTKRFVRELAMDGYEMPWVEIGGWENQVQLATCFLNKSTVHPVYPCDQRLVEAARHISKRNNSIMISAEDFDIPDIDVTLLKEFLRPWNVTVVYVYRRFYSWLQSSHNQRTKRTKLETYIANSTDFLRTNITDFIHQVISNRTNDIVKFTAAQKYQREFNNNVVILNIHDKNLDIVRQFFCHAMPYAENTCDAVKKFGDGEIVHNPSRLLTYSDLAYRAHRLGLIRITSQEQLDAAVRLIEQHQKVTLKLSDKDFDVVCPDRAILDQLLEVSLQMEKLMVPEFFASPSGESELRSDFEKQAKSSLCSIDLTGTIESSNWKGFFASLNDSLQSASS